MLDILFRTSGNIEVNRRFNEVEVPKIESWKNSQVQLDRYLRQLIVAVLGDVPAFLDKFDVFTRRFRGEIPPAALGSLEKVTRYFITTVYAEVIRQAILLAESGRDRISDISLSVVPVTYQEAVQKELNQPEIYEQWAKTLITELRLIVDELVADGKLYLEVESANGVTLRLVGQVTRTEYHTKAITILLARDPGGLTWENGEVKINDYRLLEALCKKSALFLFLADEELSTPRYVAELIQGGLKQIAYLLVPGYYGDEKIIDAICSLPAFDLRCCFAQNLDQMPVSAKQRICERFPNNTEYFSP